MSNDHDFEQVLSARLRSAAEPVTGSGVTSERVDARVAERRAGRRRRQGLVAIAAAAIVVLGGVGLSAAVDRDTPSRVASEGDPSTTEQPTTEPCVDATLPPQTTVTLPPSTALNPDATTTETTSGDDLPTTTTTTRPAAEPCAPGTTEAPTTATTAPPTTPSTLPSPTTTEPPAPTTQPAGRPGAACTPGGHPDCIDPEGDGTYVWLIGGADCMANPIGDSGNVYAHCIDLDGDGTAGYGDEGEQAVGGEPCAPGTNPDSIDPEGDGSYVFLIGGADCMASPIGGAMCADLDGDGHAGYPDSEG